LAQRLSLAVELRARLAATAPRHANAPPPWLDFDERTRLFYGTRVSTALNTGAGRGASS
jgi:hypothetical protein